MLPQSVSSCVFQSCCVWRIVSLASSITSGSYSLSASSSAYIPEPWGENVIKASHLGLSAYCLGVDLCSSSHLVKEASIVMVYGAPIYGYSKIEKTELTRARLTPWQVIHWQFGRIALNFCFQEKRIQIQEPLVNQPQPRAVNTRTPSHLAWSKNRWLEWVNNPLWSLQSPTNYRISQTPRDRANQSRQKDTYPSLESPNWQ